MPTPNALPEPSGDRVERFRTDLIRLAPVPSPARPLGLAVSGGPDSMALLALATATFPGAIAVATVDHGLRTAAADEAALVADHCAILGVPHATLRPAAPPAGASIQAKARATRYALLAHWALAHGATALLTAHHIEDQAETFLMRAARRSGVAGLAGIRPRRALSGDDGREMLLVRPLLGWRRAELRAIATASGPFADDPSNRDPAHDRSRFRWLLDGTPELDPARIAAAAAHVAEAQEALDAMTATLWRDRAAPAAGEVAVSLGDLGREWQRRLVRRALGHVLARSFDDAGVEPLLDALAAGRSATRAGVMMTVHGGTATFRLAPPRRAPA